MQGGQRRVKSVIVGLCLLLGGAAAQGVETFFSADDVAMLEELVTVAEARDLSVIETELALGAAQNSLSLEGRLAEALTITAGGGAEVYGQAVPSASISISLDLMDVLNPRDETDLLGAKLAEAKESARVRVVEAFVAYKVALQAAEVAAQDLEASSAAFEVAKVKVETGDAVLLSQLRARTEVGAAGVALYRANGDLIISLERLCKVTGLALSEMNALLGGEAVASH